MNLTDILSNPVRMRVVQYLTKNKEATTKQLSDALPDIPAPTIYRHVNFLLKEEILEVKEEKKIRGTTERLLVLNEKKWNSEVASDLKGTAYRFLMSIYRNFEEYDSENRDPEADKLSMRTFMVRLTDETMDHFLSEIADVMRRYQNDEEDGELRSISFISAPVEED